MVSIALQLPACNTQCGAKLFRVTPDLSHKFRPSHFSAVDLRCQIVARVIRVAHGDRSLVEEMIFEMPLMQWEDMVGSKLRHTDFLGALLEIYATRRQHLG